MATASESSESKKPRRPPAKTLEGRENQMISLAVDLAEQQLVNGTASAQVITHYLKLATTREQLEQAKLQKEFELLSARTEAIESGKRVEQLYGDAIKAMRMYGGQDDEDAEG